MPAARSSTGSTTSGATRTSTRPGSAGEPACRRGISRTPFAPPAPQPIPLPEGGGDRNAIPLYTLPNARVVHHFIPAMPVRVSALRALGAYMNVFSIESFMDELAHAAGADPVEFRLRHLDDARARDGSSAAAERFGWSGYAQAPGVAGAASPSRATRISAAYLRASRSRSRSSARPAGTRFVRAVAAVDSGRGRQSGRHSQPDRGRHRAVGELDAVRSGQLRRDPHHQRRLGDLSDPALPGSARQRRGPRHRPARAAVPRHRRSRAGSDGGGDRQCRRRRDRSSGCASCRSRASASKPRSASESPVRPSSRVTPRRSPLDTLRAAPNLASCLPSPPC